METTTTSTNEDSEMKPTADYVRSILDYNPTTGLFTWKVSLSNRAPAGSVAGTLKNNGYIRIKLDGKFYYAHRLAWLVMTGEWPENEIDHKNNSRADNRFCNLREATRSENNHNSSKQSNNTSGYKGVSFDKQTGKWAAYIKINGKKYHLHFHDSMEMAALDYAVAARLFFGDFSHSTINVTINNYFGDSANG